MKILTFTLTTWVLAATVAAQVPDFTPQTPLIGALLHDDPAEARRQLESGANPNDGHFVGLPPLFLAILRQDVALVRLMVASGANLDARDRSGSTALMWAAFNETGDATMVEELLALKADPAATNKVGETALVWASRRGETPAVAALRKAAGDSERTAAMKTAAQRALALLQKSSAQFSQVSGCYSCHHQALPQAASAIARTRGIAVDEAAERQQVDAAVATFTSVYEAALKNRDRIPDPPISVGYALMGLGAAHYERDAITDAMARVIAAWQGEDGGFHPLPAMRPPIEANAFTATALSVNALQHYGTASDQPRIARAREWLQTSRPRTTEELSMRTLGLAWAHATAANIRESVEALLAEQRPDGGWAQLPTLETDAYATGQALVALHTAGYAIESPAIARGIAFLLRTQFPDGSWLVRSRTFPVQPPRDTGFPHGKHQWISAAGSSWASMALALALPEPAAGEAAQ